MTKRPLVEGTELQIIDKFEAVRRMAFGSWRHAGLPPGVAHWGVAQDACMTFSLGFRSPLLSDMLSDLAVELSAQGLDQHYQETRC